MRCERILDHLLPLGDPADGARDGEQHREHVGREAERLQRDARIEVDIRIELLLDEVVVRQRDALELERDLQDRIVAMPHGVEHLVAGLLHDLRPRIVVLVDAVAEAHEAERIVLVLGALDELRNAVDRADLLQHLSAPPRWRRHGRDPTDRRCRPRCRRRDWRPMSRRASPSRSRRSARGRHAG